MSRVRRAFVAAAIAVASAVGPAGASQTSPIAVIVEAGSGLDARALRDAIARELDVDTVIATTSDQQPALIVEVDGSRVTVTYRNPGSPDIARTVDLPATPNQQIEVIALLSGNLARDEARSLAESLRPKAASSNAPPEREPEAPQTSRNEPLPPQAPSAQVVSAPERDGAVGARRPGAATHRAGGLPKRFANLSLFHPVSLLPDSHRYEVNVELGLLYGRLGGLDGAALDLGYLRVDGRASGAALSLGYIRLEGRSSGAFVSGGVLHGTELRGVGLSGLVNWHEASVRGVRLAGVWNFAEQFEGGEVASVFNYAAQPSFGVQLAGAANIARESLDGVQLAGAFNFTHQLTGVQASGAYNQALGGVSGTQVSIINVGGAVQGAQIGLFNYASSVEGLQLGLVNVADRVDGLSFAPVSVHPENRTRLVLWSDTTLLTNAAVKYSTERLYALFGGGIHPEPGEDRRAGAGAGLGVHIGRIGPVFFDADALYRYVLFESSPDELDGFHSGVYRLLLGWEPWRKLSAFAGGGLEHRARDEHEFLAYGALGLQVF